MCVGNEQVKWWMVDCHAWTSRAWI